MSLDFRINLNPTTRGIILSGEANVKTGEAGVKSGEASVRCGEAGIKIRPYNAMVPRHTSKNSVHWHVGGHLRVA